IRHVGPWDGPSVDDIPVAPSEFQVGESICEGDSGGPALDATTGAVVGVVSRGGNGRVSSTTSPSTTCVDYPDTPVTNDYTETSPFKDTILSAFAAVGHDAWVEGGPDPRLAKFGQGCGTDAECRSNICSGGTCSQTCGSSGGPPCPSGSL